MKCKVIVKKADLVEGINRYIELYNEGNEWQLYNDMIDINWSTEHYRSPEIIISENIMLKMKDEFRKIYKMGDEKKVDLAQLLKNIIKNERFDINKLFHENLFYANTKSELSEKVDRIRYICGQGAVIHYLESFNDRITKGKKFDEFFFSYYRNFLVYCLSNDDFMDLLYSDCKKEMKNTVKSIRKVVALNYNIINHEKEVREYFESELLKEEMDRRLCLDLEICEDYEKALESVLTRKNNYDFDIDSAGNLQYKNNSVFYEICECVTKKYWTKDTKKLKKIEDEFTKKLEQNKETFIEVGTYKITDFRCFSQCSLDEIYNEYLENMSVEGLEMPDNQRLFFELMNRTFDRMNARVRIFACNYKNMFFQTNNFLFVLNDGISEENRCYNIDNWDIFDEDCKNIKLTYNVDKNSFGFRLGYMLKHCTKRYKEYLVKRGIIDNVA